jgi:hypothetical protein
MTGFVVILAAMHFAVPVHCYQTLTAWQASARPDAVAYYQAGSHIALSPSVCRDVRRPTLWGANILAHELAHHWQWEQGRAFSEREADRIAARTDRSLLRRLARVLGRRAVFGPSPDNPVVLP